MNRKGFTLIELLAIIVLIGIVGVITVPSVLDAVRSSRSASYQILIKNINIAAENYYMECEYGDLSDTEKYGIYACQIDGSSITTTLGNLASTGFLKTDSSKKIINPDDNSDISDCSITITKNNDLTYSVTSNGGSDCPSTYEVE